MESLSFGNLIKHVLRIGGVVSFWCALYYNQPVLLILCAQCFIVALGIEIDNKNE